MQITTSPDITNLDIEVTWNLSGSSPVINLVNKSTGSGLADVSYAFVAKSPTGTFIHNGDIDSPDKTGIWATDTLTDNWPRPYNQIEWSGAPYLFYVIAKDSAGNIFTGDMQPATICRPAGNTSVSKNTYGVASSNVSVRCQDGRIFFEDTTYHSYKGSDGERVASTLRVIYPIDETETIPDPFAIADYSTALVPISYSSSNYQFLQNTIYDYDFGNNTIVRIKYQTIQTFAVWCNIDLEPLVCEYNKLISDVENGNCTDVVAANKKLGLISSKMFLVFMGILQPLTGVDVPKLIDEIKEIGSFDCDCCSAPTGIIPQTSSIIDGYNFSVNPVCGDVTGTVTVNGTNITFNLQDKSYVFSIANESPSETTAFSIEPTLDGCQKTYALKIDGTQLSYDILNIISNNSSLINLLNSIVNANGSNLLVDGKCIFISSNACDYTFSMSGIPASATYAIITSIKVDNVSKPVNFAFNETNIAALQTYLNALGYGTFTVTNPSSGNVTITSTANAKELDGITYSVSNVNYISGFTRDCTGYVPVTASEAVQSIIDYLCGITDAGIATSQDYTICYIDPITKTQKSVTISTGAALTDFIIELLDRGCDTINYISSLSASTCAGIKSLFPTSVKVLQSNDYLLGTKSGDCSLVYPVELGTRQLQLGINDSTFMSAFCAAVTKCSGGQICAPFNYFYLEVPYSSPTDDTMDIIVNFQHPTAISYTLRYARIDNTSNPTYITVPNVLSSPYTISGLADGQYIVGLTPIYTDGRKCTEMTQTTDLCTGINSFNVVAGGSPTDSFVISYNASASIPKIRVNISYPNGGYSNSIYTNDGSNITIPFPVGVYGDFSISLQPVCNENTGYFGASTAPSILTVINPNVVPPNFPSLVQTSNTDTGSGGTRTQVAEVGNDIVAGNRFIAQVYSHTVSYIAVSGDSPSTVAAGLANAVNSTSTSQWNEFGSAPTIGTNGYPPSAVASGNSITITLNYNNQFAFGAYVN